MVQKRAYVLEVKTMKNAKFILILYTVYCRDTHCCYCGAVALNIRIERVVDLMITEYRP